jgi:chemotaxis protein CheD
MTMTAAYQIVTVGLGEIYAVNATALQATGATVLMALGLGSCIGVAMYDPQARVAGMAHVVLPAPLDGTATPSPKFATVAVPTLLERLARLGALRRRLVCKIAGGAEVLTTSAGRHNFHIGERNLEAVMATLHREGIPLLAQDCGGKTGRSFRLAVQDGRMAVKYLGRDWQDL